MSADGSMKMRARGFRVLLATLCLLVLGGAELFVNLGAMPFAHIATIAVAAVSFHVVAFEAAYSRSRALYQLVWGLVGAMAVAATVLLDSMAALWSSAALVLYTALLLFILNREFPRT